MPAAAGADFKAGIATADRAKALVLEDRRGARAVFAQADFEVTQAVADFVAARLLQTYDLPRPSLLLRSADLRPALPDSLITVIAGAMGSMQPALIRYDGTILSVTAAGRCLAAFSSGASLTFDQCAEGVALKGVALKGAIRSAFQMAEPSHGLLQRSEPLRAYPVQAIALGKQVTVLALGGASALPLEFSGRGLIFAAHSNDSTTPPDDPRIREAIRQVLSRVR